MLTLFHAPYSRSSRILTLIDEMGIKDKIQIRSVTITRRDGSGGPDVVNPHPEGKVPCLVHDGTVITETAAIILYLTALFPNSGMSPLPGTPLHGEYLTWLIWYGSVMEPVIYLQMAGVTSPMLHGNYRGPAEMTARLTKALDNKPYLLGDTYSAADLLVHSPFAWMSHLTPDAPQVRDWVARCQARPSVGRTNAFDAAQMAVA
jgi:glutathione S-transferase